MEGIGKILDDDTDISYAGLPSIIPVMVFCDVPPFHDLDIKFLFDSYKPVADV